MSPRTEFHGHERVESTLWVMQQQGLTIPTSVASRRYGRSNGYSDDHAFFIHAKVLG
ncbi:hypothetical protein V7S43_003966 [Phytophthora oleae]|uniref:Uncharacterized protein n=1 Tax=Phytophthora oleae TaxID=2107226 RepID=A0ABD3FYE7_9STRA